MKIASEVDHLVILPKLTQNIFQFQNELNYNWQVSKIKIHI